MTLNDYSARLIGRRLTRFTVDSLVTHGGMGLIYRGTDTIRNRPVIIKVLTEEGLYVPEVVKRFERESEIVQEIRHPNIAHVYSAGMIDEVIPYYVMEYVEGQSLAELLQERGRIGGRWAIDYLRQATLGLQAAAAFNIIHRDVKPANLMISDSGAIKIVDFGIAKAMSNESMLTSVGQVMGTAMYMSPEQAKGEPVDLRSDVYSLGATFYHVITGQYPYEDDNAVRVMLKHVKEPFRPIASIRPDIPPRLQKIIETMTEKKPEKRFQNYDDLLHAIDNIFPTESSRKAPASPVTSAIQRVSNPLARACRAFPWKKTILLALLALTLALAGLAIQQHWPEVVDGLWGGAGETLDSQD